MYRERLLWRSVWILEVTRLPREGAHQPRGLCAHETFATRNSVNATAGWDVGCPKQRRRQAHVLSPDRRHPLPPGSTRGDSSTAGLPSHSGPGTRARGTSGSGDQISGWRPGREAERNHAWILHGLLGRVSWGTRTVMTHGTRSPPQAPPIRSADTYILGCAPSPGSDPGSRGHPALLVCWGTPHGPESRHLP